MSYKFENWKILTRPKSGPLATQNYTGNPGCLRSISCKWIEPSRLVQLRNTIFFSTAIPAPIVNYAQIIHILLGPPGLLNFCTVTYNLNAM